ncbi:MAG TPA: YggS family pyridoxal phosphate-dependent enzyme, partial [Solirubrobacterales bacterium]|nr:YggS family pyridoxal phosphate-dependent enzyme [Solirubrobacterales bacterium]
MPGLIHGIDPERVTANLAEVRAEAGEGVEVLVACKYVPLEEMGALAEAGVRLVGENRQQDLAAKHERWGEAFTWDFIGNLQSRKVKQVLPLVRLIHSVASDS